MYEQFRLLLLRHTIILNCGNMYMQEHTPGGSLYYPSGCLQKRTLYNYTFWSRGTAIDKKKLSIFRLESEGERRDRYSKNV